MKHCSACGGPVRWTVPEGDDRPRHICRDCGEIFYSNPKIVVGTLPYRGGEVLLCRRAIEPRRGFWTLPSGYLENGETLEEGALRETREEADVEVTIERLFSVFSLPHVDQVYLLFLAALAEPPTTDGGPESLQVRLFDEAAIPWGKLAFRAIEFALQRYVKHPGTDRGGVHVGSHDRREGGPWILSPGPSRPLS